MLLYIHIPFCDSKCPYCSFNSYTGLAHQWREYLKGVLAEFWAHQRERPARFETLYIGGGTPSTLPAEFYHRLLEEIGPFLTLDGERTIEVNPNLSPDWLRQVAPLFNRLSIGAQSFHREKLRFLGRTHTPDQTRQVVELGAQLGFREISLDLIYRTAIDTRARLEGELEAVSQLPITHLSCYALTLEEGTRFAGRQELLSPDEELEVWFIDRVRELFPQYEISNFGTPSLHNLGYWELREYRGLGAGGVGFERRGRKLYRYYHHLSVEKYLQNPLPIHWEEIGREELRLEQLFLGLRSVVGVDPKILTPPQFQRALSLVEAGFLYWGVPFSTPPGPTPPLRLVATSFLLADRLALEIWG